jgi:type IV pilus assembly protein PilP
MPRRLGKLGKNNLFLFVSIALVIVVRVSLNAALAAEDVIYKESRPMKALFETQGKTDDKGMIIDGKTVDYSYDPEGKTDPFKSFIALMEDAEKKKRRKPKTYLETLDLSQLELIAIIVGPKGNWAMVREAKGLGHVIRKGTPIGTRSGVVHEITDKQVVIREEYKDFKGRTKYKDIAKKVPALQ